MTNFRFKRSIQRVLKIQGKELFILTFVMILCLGTIVFGGQKRQEGIIQYESVAIHSGDTLWSIAEKYSEENRDVERMILEIMKVNGMCSENIRSGDKLIVPVKNYKSAEELVK